VANKLRLQVPEEWERWAHKHQPYERDPERGISYREVERDAVLLQRPHKYPRLWLPTGHIVPMPVRGGARVFVRASSQYLETSSPVVTAAAFTMACWANAASDPAGSATLISLNNNTGAIHYFHLGVRFQDAGNPVRFTTVATGASGAATTSTGVTVGTWFHGCAVEESTTARAAFLNGGSEGTNASNLTPNGINTQAVGRWPSSTPALYWDGDLAEAAIWNVALSDADVAIAAKSVSPLLAPHPESLVFYCPIIGSYSPEIDVIGSINMTVTGATKSAHPRVFYPPRRSKMPFVITGGAPPAYTPSTSRSLMGVGV